MELATTETVIDPVKSGRPALELLVAERKVLHEVSQPPIRTDGSGEFRAATGVT